VETNNLINLSDELISSSDDSFLSLCFYSLKRLPSCDNERGKATLARIEEELKKRNVDPHFEMAKAINKIN